MTLKPYNRDGDTFRDAEQILVSAAEKAWSDTLSQVPSTYGRLLLLASCRTGKSDSYCYPELSQLSSEEIAVRILLASHAETFAQWLSYSLQKQLADLRGYFNHLREDPKPASGLGTDASREALVPTSASKADRNLFLSDLEIVLKLVQDSVGEDLA